MMPIHQILFLNVMFLLMGFISGNLCGLLPQPHWTVAACAFTGVCVFALIVLLHEQIKFERKPRP